MRAAAGLLLLVASCGSALQSDEAIAAHVKSLATECTHSFVSRNFDRMADLTLPLVVEKLGGKDAMIRRLREGTKNGPQVSAVKVGTPKVHRTSTNVIYAVVPFTLDVRRLVVFTDSKDSYLLGVSEDAGTTWHFLDGSGLTPEGLRMALPNFPSDIQLPTLK